MKKKTLRNSTTHDIVDYKIEEAQIDDEGNAIKDNTGLYKTTGKTLEWTILAGETVEFPAYVADYLKYIYDFLEVVGEKNEPIQPIIGTAPSTEPKKEEVKVAKPGTGNISCKYCGQNFSSIRGLGLHVAVKHEKELL